MGFWSKLFGGQEYQDEVLVSTIQKVLVEDPLVTDPDRIAVTSKDGVIKIRGKVDRSVAKDHVEGAAREALRYKSLKFSQLVNELEVAPAKQVT